MKRLHVVLAFGLVLATSSANAWFFFIMPGVSGDRHCVSSESKVGDRVTIPGQGAALVTSVSGPSPRCTNSRYPNLVALDFGRADVVLPRGQESTECVGPGARVGDKVNIVGVGEVVVKGTRIAASQCTDAKFPLQATVIRPGMQQTSALPLTALVPAPTPIAPEVALKSWEPEKSFHGQPCVPQSAKTGDKFYDSKNGNGVIRSVLGPWYDCTDPAFPYRATVRFSGEEPRRLEAAAPLKQTDEPTRSSSTAQKLRELSGLLKDGVITQDDYESKKKELLKSY